MADARADALFRAVEAGAEGVVGVLVKQFPDLVEARSMAGATPLILAAQLGHVGVMKELVTAGADVEALDNAQFTPLMHACLYAQRPAALFLIEQGAYAGRRNTMGMTAAALAKSADFPSFADEIAGIAASQPEIEKAFWKRESEKAGQGLEKPVAVRRSPIRFKL